ncbi:uncharacterized protein LOC135808552 isoform X2 [Sycon ciliatum]|uniref:uncharacterized protein LOC135808552 isoform X2 n=1 Tax=Sycon ciliatum TaxID=27933 RepID=UPI0031F70CBC
MMASGNEACRKLTLARDGLIQDLSPILFLDQLVHREVVVPGAAVDRTHAAMKNLGRTDAARVLLEYLERKVAADASVLDKLIDSLKESNQKHLAELLRRPVPPPVQAGATPGNDTTFTAVQPTGINELDSCPPKDIAAGSELYDLSKESLQDKSDHADSSECVPSGVDVLRRGRPNMEMELTWLLDVEEFGRSIEKHLSSASCEDLARHAVKAVDDPVHNFRNIVTRWIRDNEKGRAELDNVPGVLAYYMTSKSKPTCQHLLNIIEKINPGIAPKVKVIINSAKFDRSMLTQC